MAKMTYERAKYIANDVRHAVRKWGKNGYAPYPLSELQEAMATLIEGAQDEITAIQREAADLVKAANLKAAAANARAAKASKREEEG